MTKKDILKAIREIEKEDGKTDFSYDENVDRLFYDIAQRIELPFDCYLRNSSGGDSWLQSEYYSDKLRKTIIWNYDVGNFDDKNELADFIIRESKEIEAFEAKLPDSLKI